MEYIEVVIGFKDIPAVNPAKALESALKTLCPKEFFYTEGDAKYRLNYIRKMKAKYNQKHDIPVRVYKCEKCGYWHLTSKQRIGEEIIPTNQEEEKDVYQPVLMDKWLKLLNKED
jgi:NDP-sugar pyrophosphorylase family protein